MRISKLMLLPVVAFAMSVPTMVAQTPARHLNPKLSRRKAAPKPFVLPPVSKAPLPQVPMDMLPAAAPHVAYQDGMLTIVAENATLGDILRQVHKLTGASIDVPANATERVAARLGPAPARTVLADLLNGSAFNYVMLGKDSDPNTLVAVNLTSKPAGGAAATETAAYQPPPQFQPQQMGMPLGAGPGGQVAQQQSEDEEADAEEEPEENAEADQDQAGANAAANENGTPNAGPRNPQEILEMLRRQMPNAGQQGGAPGQGVNPPQQPPQQPPPQEQPQ